MARANQVPEPLRTPAPSAVKIVTYLMRQHEACLLDFHLSGGAARKNCHAVSPRGLIPRGVILSMVNWGR